MHVHNKNSIIQGRSPNVIKVMFHTILRRKSLVSTDTVCNNFVRQS